MSRTFRRKGETHPRDIDYPGVSNSTNRGGSRYTDKDIQKLPKRSYRSDGVSVRPDWDDMCGHGYRMGKALRLTKHAHIKMGLEEVEDA